MTENKKSVFEGWKFLKPKSGGVNEAGEHGGVYQSLDGKTTVMIKKENSTSKNIAEFLGSQIFEAISPGNGAIVTLIAPDKLNKSKSNDSQIYVKSEFFKDYSSDMYVDMDKHMSNNTKPSSLFRKDGGRPLFMGSRNKLFRTLDNAFKEVKYQNFENIMPTSLLIGDFDIHVGNIGVIRDSKNLKTLPQLVRIDFAGSLNDLTNKIHPHSRAKHLPGFGPTNHFREFPSALRTKNPKFADSLLASSEVDLSKTIDKSFKELAKYYSDEAIIAFAKRAMPRQFDNSQAVTLEEAKTGFLEGITKRQESLKEYGLEIKLSTLISKKYNHPYYEIKEQELKSLMKEHPDYFNKILKYEDKEKGGRKLKLYNKVSSTLTRILEALGIRPSARGQLIKTIKNLNEEVNSQKDLIDFREEAQVKKAKASTKTKEQPDLLELNEKDLKNIKKLKEEVLKPTKQEKIKSVKLDKQTIKWQDEVSKKSVKNKNDMTHS